MKKIFNLLLLIFIIITLSSCSNGEKITKDNYKDFFDVEEICRGMDPIVGDSGPIAGYIRYKSIEYGARIKAYSSNYDYKNLEFKYKVTGTYSNPIAYNSKTYIQNFDKEFVVKCNIAGSGEYKDNFIPYKDAGLIPSKSYEEFGGYDGAIYIYDVKFELISVKGKAVR